MDSRDFQELRWYEMLAYWKQTMQVEGRIQYDTQDSGLGNQVHGSIYQDSRDYRGLGLGMIYTWHDWENPGGLHCADGCLYLFLGRESGLELQS